MGAKQESQAGETEPAQKFLSVVLINECAISQKAHNSKKCITDNSRFSHYVFQALSQYTLMPRKHVRLKAHVAARHPRVRIGTADAMRVCTGMLRKPLALSTHHCDNTIMRPREVITWCRTNACHCTVNHRCSQVVLVKVRALISIVDASPLYFAN